MTDRRASGAERNTVILAVALSAVGVLLAVAGYTDPLVTSLDLIPPVALTTALAGLFCLGELCLVHVEVRRQAYSLSLVGVPVVLGVLLCAPWQVVVARVAGSVVAFGIQRVPAIKAFYNAGAYAAEAALATTVTHWLVGGGVALDELTARIALTCYAVLLVVDQGMTALVIQVIRWHTGRVTAHEAAEMFVPSLLMSVLATTSGFAVFLLVGQGPLGVLVLAVWVGAGAAVYRGFQVLHRRHVSLEQVHEFVGLTGDPGSVDDLAGKLLRQVRSLLRATRAELLLLGDGPPRLLCVAEDEVLHIDDAAWTVADPVLRAARAGGETVLVPAGSRRPADRAWLRDRGVRDAVLAPLPGGAGDGVLLVTDRLGDTGSFTADDGSLLATLAGHLAVAVRSGALLDRLRHDATHDALTGLANRSLLQQTLQAALDRGPRDSAVLLLDLDRFKEVNDTLGHHVGDALLRSVATTIRSTLPADATVARLGGDEFAALVPDVGDPERVLALAHELAVAVAVPVRLPDAVLTTRASIGVALATRETDEADLLRHADTAMYAAKESGDPVVLYTAEFDRGRAERLALVADLHLALERDELELHYQPKLDLRTGQVASVEALVRWQHPRLGLLSPNVFVPLAELNALIGPLTRKVLATALRQCRAWQAEGIDVSVAVNLSARSVSDPGLPEAISAALLEAGLPASRLVLEITESSVMADPERAVEILERIAAIGVALSLDDFGTGYSSLAYLQRLPVSEVKIDRTFVAELSVGDARSQVLVRSIINLASNLGHRVVGEGAETAETVELLREMGCDLVQGYAISPPAAVDQTAAFIRRIPAPQLRAVRGGARSAG